MTESFEVTIARQNRMSKCRREILSRLNGVQAATALQRRSPPSHCAAFANTYNCCFFTVRWQHPSVVSDKQPELLQDAVVVHPARTGHGS